MAGDRDYVIPGLTTMVGRESLLYSVRRLLADGVRLVTLAGSGGVGKTRLATELWHYAQADYEKTAFVRLVDLSEEDTSDAWSRIGDTLVTALEITDHRANVDSMEVLVKYLREHRVLLVLDNCEHIQNSVAEIVAILLEEVPTVQILATSRSYLQISGERIVNVAPLNVPGVGVDRKDALLSEAVLLLIDRTTTAGRALTENDDWTAIVDLVRWSDGVPLILELFAAQLGIGRTPSLILERLHDGLSLRYPTGTRRIPAHHQALNLTVDGSWELCAEKHHRLWARLAVFSGGFTIDAVEGVCGDELVPRAEILELLEYLVRQSIVVPAGEDGRYGQHNFLRSYGLRRLEEFGELQKFRDRHCDWVFRLTQSAAANWFSPDEVIWLKRIYGETANIRSAVTWCRTNRRIDQGLSIVTDVLRMRMPFFYALETQFCAMMDDLLALGSGETQEMRVSAISMLGWTRIVLGDRVRGLAHLEECERIIGDVALSDTPPPVLFLRGIYLVLSHADPAGLGLLAVACEGFRAVGAEGDVQMVLLIRALSAGLMGPAELADAVSEKCLEHAQQQNASWAMTWALWTLGLPARTHSLDVLRESLAKQIELGDHWGTTWGVEAEAWRRAAIGDHVVAARLLGGSISLQQRHGVQISGLVPFAKQRELTQARIIAGIGKDHFEHAYQAGEGLTTNEVFKLALGEGDDPEDSLSPRRLLIAQLVAQGKRNWEIAALTGVQQRTVEANLSHIFKVVNVENREQLTKWYHDKYGQSEED